MKRTRIILTTILLFIVVAVFAQNNTGGDAKMKTFIDALMNKMTTDEKLGQ